MRQGQPRWILAESPGGIGDPEVWIDAHALDSYGGKDGAVVRHVLGGNGGGPWIGALLEFGNYPGVTGARYLVVARRHSQANGGEPYYVAKFPG